MRLPFRLDDPRFVRLLPLLLGLAAFVLAAKNLIGGYGDLGIYLDVGHELRQGGVDICRARPESGAWAYPPVAGLPFVLLQALFADGVVRWIWCVGLGLATALLAIDLRAVLRHCGGLRWWQWLAFAVLFQRCIAQNLTHGQLSLWVGACLLRGIAHLLDGRDLRAGAWLAAATALKLTPLAFVVALPLMGRPRAAIVQLLTLLVAVLLVPWPVLGTDEHLWQLRCFWTDVLAPMLGQGKLLVVTDYHAGPSVAGTFDYLLQARDVDDDGHRVNLLDVGDGALRAIKAVWSLGLLALLGTWALRARRLPTGERLAEQAAVVTLAIAFFSPLTRVYHLAGALLPGALFCRGPRTRRDGLWWLATAAILLSMTLRQKNLLGETLWRALDVGGLLHFGLVALVAWSVARLRPRADAGSRAESAHAVTAPDERA